MGVGVYLWWCMARGPMVQLVKRKKAAAGSDQTATA